MTERKFTDEEVIRALKHYKGFRLYPFSNHEKGDDIILVDDALDLINRQRAEIESLNEIVFMDRTEAIKMLKAEAIKEFAERLKEKMNNLSRMEYHCAPYFLVSKDFIDKTAKELTESKPCTDGADCFAAEGKE